MNTFSYSHVVDMTGGRVSATLDLDLWYAIDEDGKMVTGHWNTKEQVIAKLEQLNVDAHELTWTTDPDEVGLSAEIYVCTGQQYKDFYDGSN